MNEQIKRAIQRGELALFLGAGASAGSRDSAGRDLLFGGDLARELAGAAGLPYAGELLRHVYAAAQAKLGDKLLKLLEERYRHCTPSSEYLELAKYPWPRIYTLNIDDALERALAKASSQNVAVRGLQDRVEDQDQYFERLDVVKLNGCVNNLQAGVIFSPQQYARTAAAASQWYEQLGIDFFRYTFLFIGTKLDESIFFQQVERYRDVAGAAEGESYLVVPSVSEIERTSLASQHVIHVPGDVAAFCTWLQSTFPVPSKPIDVAIARHPQLATVLFDAKSDADQYYYANLFQHVERIDKTLPALQRTDAEKHATRNFYLGFKPTWSDIHEGVPAVLASTREFVEVVKRAIGKQKLVVLYGPAGSGKSTLLMQAAYHIMRNTHTPVYALTQPADNLGEILNVLDKVHNEPYVIFTDKLDSIVHELNSVLKSHKLLRGTVVGSERQNIWIGRTRDILGEFSGAPFKVSEIHESDAEAILKKVEQFGPWQRLRKLSSADRVHELVAKAKRQLLIGLLETTLGDGFEKLIEEDYKRLKSREERLFLTVVGLATVHRSSIKESLVYRALRNLGIVTGVPQLLRLTAGITLYANGALYARHPVYVRYLFEHVIDPSEIQVSIKALLGAFGAYRVPIAKYAAKNERYVFKSILNHRFLREVLRGQDDLILDVFRSYEKVFQEDGLFWLHYGLALRECDEQDEALSKLKTAYEAYSSVQAEHALAQQKLILGRLTDSRTKAYVMLDEAKKALDRLDQVLELIDAYPIVTLSEGHVAIVLKFEGKEPARTLAKDYFADLNRRIKGGRGGERIDECAKRLMKFAVNPSLNALAMK
ncbi:MAG TPA: SIR2 family protein [Burkholderiales bacterium]|nr:SIR2 family protein [Burkholderiales bacterium]